MTDCYRDSCVVQLWNPTVAGYRGVPTLSEIAEIVSQKHFPRTTFTQIQLKPAELSEQLLTYCRRPLVSQYKSEHLEAESLFACSPTLEHIETNAALDALSLLQTVISTRFPTFDSDLLLFQGQPDPLSREYLAVSYRIQQKRIIDEQIRLLGVLLQTLSGTLPGFLYEELRFLP